MTDAYRIEGLHYKYGDNSVIDLAQYEFQQAMTHVLVGPNGSGKTTLFNVLSLLLKPLSGEIYLLGEKVIDENRLALRRRIGYVQQRPYLFNTSVFENIAIGMKLRGVSKHLRESRTNNIIEQLGLNSLKNKRAHELSGGEMQKIALARTLVLEPEILILDEPFTYLDKAFSLILETLLLNIREHKTQTVIISTHDHMRAHLLGDHVSSIINGKLIDESTINLIHGRYLSDKQVFDTGKLLITIGHANQETSIIAVEPNEIVLSLHELDSSMRNRFQGHVTGFVAYDDRIEVSIDAGEKFHAVISDHAMKELDLEIGSKIWVSFKSSAVKLVN